MLVRTESKLQTVDGVTSLHGDDGWVLDYSGRQTPLKNRSFAVRCLDSKAFMREISKTLKPQKPREWDRLIRTLQARQSLNRRDLFSAVETYGLHRNQQPTDEELGVRAGEVQVAISSEITRYLRGARLVTWAHKQTGPGGWLKPVLRIGLLCPNLTSALFAFAVLDELRACKCGSIFQPSRPDQHYCSIRCRETYRKRTLRAKAKAQGGK